MTIRSSRHVDTLLERFRGQSNFSCIGDTGKVLGGDDVSTVSEERAVGLGWEKGSGVQRQAKARESQSLDSTTQQV